MKRSAVVSVAVMGVSPMAFDGGLRTTVAFLVIGLVGETPTGARKTRAVLKRKWKTGNIREVRAIRGLNGDVNWQEHITVDPAVLVGKPIIKGTRLAVEFILELIAEGWSEAEMLRNYPGLTRQQILACVACTFSLKRSVYSLFFARMRSRT
jgi:uncharacterized protein (DUF433 family)